MATATKEAKSDSALSVQTELVPKSDMQAMLALDATSQSCSRQLIEAGKNEAVKALVLARGLKQLKKMLTDAVMADIMELQNSPLGYRTDKRETGYPMAVVRDVVVQAFMRGLRVTGNEINIIAGNLYVTKEGFERLLSELAGLTNLHIQIGVPKSVGDGALVPAKASWRWHGEAMSQEWEETEAADYRIPIRVNSAMGVDAILGKAKSKVMRTIYSRLTGSQLMAEGDAGEAIDGEVVKESEEKPADGKLFVTTEAGSYGEGH